MDETDGSTVFDNSSYGNDGTIVDGAFQNTTSSAFGDSFSFDGDTDYISVDNSDSIDLSQNFSTSIWINLNKTATSDFIYRKSQSCWQASNYGHDMIFGSSNNPKARFCNGTDLLQLQFGTNLGNVWHHLLKD